MAKTLINYCYFQIEGYSSAFFYRNENLSSPVPRKYLQKRVPMLVLCVPAQTHSPAIPLRPFSHFFHCLRDWINSPDPAEPKGTGWGVRGCGERLAWPIWVCKTEVFTQCIGWTVLVCNTLCNCTAVPKQAEVCWLVSHMDSLQLLVRKMQNSRDLFVCVPPDCFLLWVPLFYAWSISAPSRCFLRAQWQMLSLKFGLGSSSEVPHITMEKWKQCN